MASSGETSLDELALPQLLGLYHKISARAAEPPVIVDYDDLLEAPEQVLTALCKALGVAFDTAMLSWKAGPKDCDGIWAKHWYESVHRTTGFDSKASSSYQTLPADLMPVLRAATPFYQVGRKVVSLVGDAECNLVCR